MLKFETFTFGDLDKYDKSSLADELSYYSDIYTFAKKYDKQIKTIIEEAILKFKSKIPIFDKIKVQLVKSFSTDKSKKSDTIGKYVHESCLRIPIILIGLKEIYEAVSEYGSTIDVALKSTIYHELGHAMVDLDNQIEFVEDENILDFEDEEEYVEDFAFNFEMFDEVPEEINKLIEIYKKHIIKEEVNQKNKTPYKGCYVITKDFPDYIGQINREVFATWAGDGNYYNSQLNRELNYIVSYEEGTYSFLSVKIKFKDILYWSPNKQELEPFIAANKFGI